MARLRWELKPEVGDGGSSPKSLRRGWCLGSKPFRAELLKYVEAQRARWHYGRELAEAAEAEAERLIGAALQGSGVSAEQLARWPKGHPFKVGWPGGCGPRRL